MLNWVISLSGHEYRLGYGVYDTAMPIWFYIDCAYFMTYDSWMIDMCRSF